MAVDRDSDRNRWIYKRGNTMGTDSTQTNAINENTNQIDLPSCISIWPDSMDQRGRYQEDAGIKEREGGRDDGMGR